MPNICLGANTLICMF